MCCVVYQVSVGNGGKGTPPQVWGVVWNPFSQGAGKTLGQGEFVTYGVKHIKLWRLCKDADGYYYGYVHNMKTSTSLSAQCIQVTSPTELQFIHTSVWHTNL